MTDGEQFIKDVEASYNLAPHEARLISLAGQALDAATAAATELAEHVERTGSVLLGDKIHPASNVARDQGRLFELLTRAAALPADATGESVRRLREVG